MPATVPSTGGRRACPRRCSSGAAPCRAPPRCSRAGPASSALICCVLRAARSPPAESPGSSSCGRTTMSRNALPVVAVDRARERRHLLVDLGAEDVPAIGIERLVDLVDPQLLRAGLGDHRGGERRRGLPCPSGRGRSPTVKSSLTFSCGSGVFCVTNATSVGAAVRLRRRSERGQRRQLSPWPSGSGVLRQRRDDEVRSR